MPGTSIGIKFPSPTKNVFQAALYIRKRDGKYLLGLQPYAGEEPNVAEEIRRALESAIRNLNGD